MYLRDKKNSVISRLIGLKSVVPPALPAGMTLLLVTLGFFGDTLFSSSQVVLSHSLTDLARQFVYWRDFGFSQLKQGNLALWNPYIYSGAPYFGGFQSDLLYPPNWFYLILPLSKAINFGIALHVFLAGLFMYLWTSQRGIHFAACLMSALLFMFCGAHSLHVYAGHLTNLCTRTWAPLLFLAIDGYFKKLSSAWVWVGVLAISMQILAGHPQYVFFTAVAAGIYTLLRLPQRRRWWQVLLGTSAMYTGAALLCAVQLLTGLQATSESVRAGGISYAMASMLSFPLENFVTLLAPGFLGDMISFPYWGRWYLWEMCLFMSVTGLVLAIYGALSGDRKTRCFSVTLMNRHTVLLQPGRTLTFPDRSGPPVRLLERLWLQPTQTGKSCPVESLHLLGGTLLWGIPVGFTLPSKLVLSDFTTIEGHQLRDRAARVSGRPVHVSVDFSTWHPFRCLLDVGTSIHVLRCPFPACLCGTSDESLHPDLGPPPVSGH